MVGGLPSTGAGCAPGVHALQRTPGVGAHGVQADDHKEIIQDRWAAFLRCSDEELQDPNLSLDRQLHTCRAAVDRWGGQVTAIYYEVETGTSRYQQRGSKTSLAGFDIPIPRAGGLHELVADAARRRFDRVVCESISRLARHSAVAFTLEDTFRAAGIGLHCADEPLEESFGAIVLRHLNVGLARGYIFSLKQLARRGAETATRQGWHMGGIPPYGYRLAAHAHPNPHKRQRGLAEAGVRLPVTGLYPSLHLNLDERLTDLGVSYRCRGAAARPYQPEKHPTGASAGCSPTGSPTTTRPPRGPVRPDRRRLEPSRRPAALPGLTDINLDTGPAAELLARRLLSGDPAVAAGAARTIVTPLWRRWPRS